MDTITTGIRKQSLVNKDYYGKVYFKILEARNTLAMDITGTSDPYCLVTVIDSAAEFDKKVGDVYKTEVIYKTLNPVWKDEEFVFDVPKSSSVIYVEMWDEDSLKKDDRMGRVRVNIDEYRSRGMKDIWLPIEGKPGKKYKNRGDLHVQILFQTYDNFIQLLDHPDNILVKSVTKLILADEFVKALLYTLSTQSHIITMIKDLIQLEITNTENSNVLFRTDSLATKLTISFFKIIGLQYLKNVLKPHILNIVDNNIQFEVDPSKGVTEAEIENNFKIFLYQCQIFLDAITVSYQQFPEPLHVICSHIRQCVEKKFPADSSTYSKAVGGFVFLRFINPALFSPESLKLIPSPPSNESRRSLTLITKIIQNLSNQIVFSNKEQYLEKSNTFIANKVEEVVKFLQEISVPIPETKIDYSTKRFEQVRCEPAKLIKHLDTIVKHFEEKRTLVLENMNNHTQDKEYISKFSSESSVIYSLIQKQLHQSTKKCGKDNKDGAEN